MIARLTQSAIAFAVTAVAYQLYVLTVVPLVEPTFERSRTTAALAAPEGDATNQYHDVFAAYFRSDHWTLQQPPIAFENGELIVAIDDFKPTDDGKIRVEKCAILFFPGGRNRSAGPPRNAIILEPSEPAVLQTDDPKAIGLGRFVKLQRGWLPGEVVIYSDMGEPGPEDDLRVTTRDIYINEDLIRSSQAVEFKLGRHFGHGRGIEIRLLPTRGAGDESLVGGLHGFESLEITSEVSVEIAMDEIGEASRGATLMPSSEVAAVEPPLRVTSSGPFRFEFGHYKASFEDRVLVRQLHPGGQLDQLAADVLNLYFDPKGRTTADLGVTPTPSMDAGPLTGAHLATVEAIGFPVRLDAPSRNASIRCGKMLVELTKRRVILELPSLSLGAGDAIAEAHIGELAEAQALESPAADPSSASASVHGPVEGLEEVAFRYRGTEVHASMIQYEHPAEGSPHVVGQLWAKGDGWLRSDGGSQRTADAFDVDWKKSMQLVRHEGQPVLTLHGRPAVTHAALGKLWADVLHLYLNEASNEDLGEDPGEPAPQRAGSIKPDRLVAQGLVAIDSAELNVQVNTMALWFEYPAEDLLLAEPSGENSEAVARSLGIGRGAGGRRRYDIRGDVLNMQINVRGDQHEVAGIRLDGEAEFRESSGFDNAQPPLHVLAQSLRVDHADTPSAVVTIVGPAPSRSPTEAADEATGWAEINVGGNTLWAEQLQIKRDESQAWIKSPGRIRMMLDRDFSGSALAEPKAMSISWQDSMQLDGDRITFLGDVEARTTEGRLNTRRLDATLSHDVQFDGASKGRPPEVVEIACSNGVVAQFEQRDQLGPTAQHTARLQSLNINFTTGDFSGHVQKNSGIGIIESVHLSASANPLPSISAPLSAGADRAEPASGQKLRHLRIEFASGLRGNLDRRLATVFGNVRTLYGPVDAWEQRLSMDVGREPGPGEVWITSDQQQVQENPRAAAGTKSTQLGPLELTALGEVEIDGYHPSQGYFTALGHRAVYDQEKTMFVIEGKAGQTASITSQRFVGAPPSRANYRMFKYWLDTGRITAIQPTIQHQQYQQNGRAAAPDRPLPR